MQRARPTLRALTEDLKLSLPPIDEPLDEISHPLLSKAIRQFSDPLAKRERIRAIDDEVVWKVKIQRWRGAVWADDEVPWLVAAGTRKEGSADDFYKALSEHAQAARSRYNAGHPAPLCTQTYIGHLLPTDDDNKRRRLEAGVRDLRELISTIRRLISRSLRDGREYAADFMNFRLGIVVRADEGHETYVAIRIAGSVRDDLVSVILRNVPGCDPALWDAVMRLPDRTLTGPEQAWFNLMDPIEAAKILDADDGPGR
jgi:hypothetical protein